MSQKHSSSVWAVSSKVGGMLVLQVAYFPVCIRSCLCILNASSSARKKKKKREEKSAYRTAIFPSYISRKITKSNIGCDLTFKFHNKLSMHVLVQGVVTLSPYKIPLWTYRKSSSSEAKLFWEKYSCYSE